MFHIGLGVFSVSQNSPNKQLLDLHFFIATLQSPHGTALELASIFPFSPEDTAIRNLACMSSSDSWGSSVACCVPSCPRGTPSKSPFSSCFRENGYTVL